MDAWPSAGSSWNCGCTACPGRRPRPCSVAPTEFLEQWSPATRRRASTGASHGSTTPPPLYPSGDWRKVPEAYSWGGLTSGLESRALWLLFLPFIFINLAHWMLPPTLRIVGPPPPRSACCDSSRCRSRLTLMLASAVAAMDIMAWQCPGLDYSARPMGPLTFWRRYRGRSRAQRATADGGDRGAVEAGPEMPGPPANPPYPAVTDGEVPLGSAICAADPSVLRLRACHVTGWTAGLAALMLAVPARYATTSSARSMSASSPPAVNAALIVAIAGAATAAIPRPPEAAKAWRGRPARRCRCGGYRGVACRVAGLGRGRRLVDPLRMQFPGLRGAIYVMLGVQAAGAAGPVSFRRAMPAGASHMPPTGPRAAPRPWAVDRAVRGADRLVDRGRGSVRRRPAGCLDVPGRPVPSPATAAEEIARQDNDTRHRQRSFEGKTDALSRAPLIVPPPYIWAAVASSPHPRRGL